MRAVLALAVVLVTGWAGGSDSSGIRGCPRDEWPGPWTACAEARWVERVVENAGYDVDGGTGSALIAGGSGRVFYVWAANTGRDDDDPSDDGVRTSWSAQGFTFWVSAGPAAGDMKPTIPELAPVVSASHTTAPPPE